MNTNLSFGLVALGVVVAAGSASAARVDDPLRHEVTQPRTLIVSDYYTYSTPPLPSEPLVDVYVDANGWNQTVALYLYLIDRESGAERFYTLDPNTGTVALRSEVTPLIGNAAKPLLVPVPDWGTGVRLFGPESILGPLPGVDPSGGHWAVVFEIRDAEDRVLARDNAMLSYVESAVSVEGVLSGSQTWTRNNVYVLTDQLFVPDGVTLTIEPGTVVLGDPGAPFASALAVQQGGRLIADCTERMPCRFTSAEARSGRQTQDFGGIILNGFAPTNQGLSPPPEGEGQSGRYGGTDSEDSSGVLDHVVIEYAGSVFNSDDELNCLALQGVGRGTQLSNIQCIGGSDDGVEFFGGTADISNLMLVANEDDQLDWTFGWNGRGTNICAVHNGSPPSGSADSNNCIEADNDGSNNDALPRSAPTIENFTCVTGPASTAPKGEGLLLRRGTAIDLRNALISNVFIGEDSDVAIDVNGGSSQALLASGDLRLDVLIDGVAPDVLTSPPDIAGVLTGNGQIADGGHDLKPRLAPRIGARGCTTRSDDWTQGLWLNWDFRQR